MKKLTSIIIAAVMCISLCLAMSAAEDESGTSLTVYVKNTAGWETINIFAWDEHDGAATDMEWVETPMEDIGGGWYSHTLTSYLEFYLCFQNGGEVWTNDVPVEAGVSEIYLELSGETRGEKQICQYTEERPGADENSDGDSLTETEVTVYMKNSAGWETVNIFAWDDHDGAATNMEWVETPMEDIGGGWLRYTFKSYLDYYLCFQNGAEIWSNDVPVEQGVSEVYLEMKPESRGDKQLCQYTDSRPGDAEEEPASPEEPDESATENAPADENAPAPNASDNSPTESSSDKESSSAGIIAAVVAVVIIAAVVCAVVLLKKKK